MTVCVCLWMVQCVEGDIIIIKHRKHINAAQAVPAHQSSSSSQSALVCCVGTEALCDTFLDALRVDTAMFVRREMCSIIGPLVRSEPDTVCHRECAYDVVL